MSILDLAYGHLPIFGFGSMIAKIIGRGTGFGGLSSYLRRAGTPEEVRAEDMRAINVSSAERAAAEMRFVANDFGNPSRKPVWHATAAWSAADIASGVTPLQQLDATQVALERLGLGHHQALLVRHGNHVHAEVNLVDPNTGRVWNGWQSKARLERIVADIGRECGLELVKGKHNGGLPRDAAADRAATVSRQPERAADRERKLGIESSYSRAKADQQLVDGLKAARSWDDLRVAARARGWEVVRFTDGRRDGLVLVNRIDPAQRVAVSKVAGGDLGYLKLSRRFGPYPEVADGWVDRPAPASRDAPISLAQPVDPARAAARPPAPADPLETAARRADRRVLAQARQRWERDGRKESWAAARRKAVSDDRQQQRERIVAHKRDVNQGRPTPDLDPRVAHVARREGWARPEDLKRVVQIETARAESRADRHARRARHVLRPNPPPPRARPAYKAGWIVGDAAARGLMAGGRALAAAPGLAKKGLAKIVSVAVGVLRLMDEVDRAEQQQVQQVTSRRS
jgi:hypothetical protein